MISSTQNRKLQNFKGRSLWNDENGEISVDMIKFQDYIRKHWFIVPSNTQLVERGVKDENECTWANKDEHFASLIALLRLATYFNSVPTMKNPKELSYRENNYVGTK